MGFYRKRTGEGVSKRHNQLLFHWRVSSVLASCRDTNAQGEGVYVPRVLSLAGVVQGVRRLDVRLLTPAPSRPPPDALRLCAGVSASPRSKATASSPGWKDCWLVCGVFSVSPSWGPRLGL